MTVVSLRLERVAVADADRHLVAVGAIRLVRTDAGVSAEVEAGRRAHAVAMLARAGLRVVSVEAPEPPTRGLAVAVVTHLDPLGAAGIVDVLSVRSTGEGEATARLARRPLFRRRSAPDGMKAILAGSDRAYLWRRTVFARPKTLRALRGVRPVVFDHGAVERADERLALVGRSALTRWLA